MEENKKSNDRIKRRSNGGRRKTGRRTGKSNRRQSVDQRLFWHDRRDGSPELWITIWGARGSCPISENSKIHYGGNTSCIEVRTDKNDLIIFDCGSGVRPFGKKLQEEFGQRPIQGHILLSHLHWDHIQGIPVFLPLYEKENSFTFYSFASPDHLLQNALERQMSSPFFPVDMKFMRAHRDFHEIKESTFELLEGVKLETCWLNHPQDCMGYRIEYKSRVLVYVTDHEPGIQENDERWMNLCRNANIVISDAQYLTEELAGPKKGWGHGSYEASAHMASQCGVEHLILYHHDPDRTDSELKVIEQKARKIFPGTVVAAEELCINV